MESPNQLTARFKEVYLNGKWVAKTNYKEQLEKLTWQEATQKVGNLNTIAALTFHINYYTAGLNQVFEGGALTIRDKFSFDCPPIESAEDWEKLKNKFLSDAETFAAHLENMTEAQLDAPFIEEEYGTYRRNIEGVVEHAYYHLGQVSLLRKMIKEMN